MVLVIYIYTWMECLSSTFTKIVTKCFCACYSCCSNLYILNNGKREGINTTKIVCFKSFSFGLGSFYIFLYHIFVITSQTNKNQNDLNQAVCASECRPVFTRQCYSHTWLQSFDWNENLLPHSILCG